MNNKELLLDYLQKQDNAFVIGTFTEYRGCIGTIEYRTKNSYIDNDVYCVILGTGDKHIECSASDTYDLYTKFKSCVNAYVDKLDEKNMNPLLAKYGLTKDEPYNDCMFGNGLKSERCKTCDSCPRGDKFIIPDDDVTCFKHWNNFLIDYDKEHDYEKLKTAMYEKDSE